MKAICRLLEIATGGCLTAACIVGVLQGGGWGGILLACSLMFLALRLQFSNNWQPFAFSSWVLAFVVVAMSFPTTFLVWYAPSLAELGSWYEVQAPTLISPLIQIIMFGMGTTLSAGDFARVLKSPVAVLVGMSLQFSVMPLSGFALAWVVQLPPEVAAGVVLIGSCPGGVASNVITYLARGDVALSVTMTACSTLLSPFLTPVLMYWLAGSYLPIDMWSMLTTILLIVILPVAAGLLANAILARLQWRGRWLDQILSVVAMFSICIVVGIIVAQSSSQLMVMGPLLIVLAIVHNALGLAAGYFGARLFGLSEGAARTISIEVGMQNGGMAAALATKTLGSPSAALAGAIFGAWMNVSGSLLASWWRGSNEPPPTVDG